MRKVWTLSGLVEVVKTQRKIKYQKRMGVSGRGTWNSKRFKEKWY